MEFYIGVNKEKFSQTFQSYELPDTSLYNQLNEKLKNGNIITESLGVYYQEDNPKTPEIMKNEKRIITYKITTKQ